MSTLIASRTWEGEPRRCGICHQVSRVEPSLFAGDAPCPACGTLLWPSDRHRPVVSVPARRSVSRIAAAGRAVLSTVRVAVNAAIRTARKRSAGPAGVRSAASASASRKGA